ncbi:hypothetical protein JTE90_017942 [Oedothorax gibbosus]|uniref:Uncharacterized protein n=1 Tax=Oedothorax gibbosus TaxID=931172 RepID=A0AAV6V849_9ARAC|nr:hypothetical protein JTE90_017942 [Oedothorax gibbosus]
MPVDLEMLLSAPRATLFPFQSYVDDHRYSGYDGSYYSHRPNYLLRSNSIKRYGFLQDRPVFREYEKPPTDKSTSERKKKVSFADDRGLNLVEVREIPGAPKWTDDVLALLTGKTQDSQLPEKVWKLASETPPRADDKLLELLEKNKVGLEMVTVKKPGDILTGTIKCCGNKYWDNNGAINYRLVADSSTESLASVHRSEDDKLSDSKITLSLTENMDKFSEIDSWSNFMYNQPYW